MNLEALAAVGGATLLLGALLCIPGYFLAKYLRRFPASPQDPGVILPPETSLLARGIFTPPGFVHGIELLNDEGTPMEFVVDALMKIVDLDKKEATKVMLATHLKGGAMVPMQSLAIATSAAQQISETARSRGYPLLCRAVSAQPTVQADGHASGQ